MATYTSAATGNWSAGATWVGGIKPPANDGHRIIIAAGHTVTYDETSSTYGDDTTSGITVNGTLRFSRSVNTELICRGTLTVSATGTLDMGTEASPISSVSAVLAINDSAVLAANKYSLTKSASGQVYMAGATRTRRTTLTAQATSGATSIQVAAATGWQVGDTLLLIPTDTSATPTTAIQTVTIASGYTSGNLTVPLSAGNAVTRASGAHVANLTSNVRIRESSTAHGAVVNLGTDNVVNGVDLLDVELRIVGAGTNGSVSIGLLNTGASVRHRLRRCSVWQPASSNVPYFVGRFGSSAEDTVIYNQGGSQSGTQRIGCTMQRVTIVTAGNGPSESAGVNGRPQRGAPLTDAVLVSGRTAALGGSSNLVYSGDVSSSTYIFASNAANDGGAVTLPQPGLVYRACDFAPNAAARPLFTVGNESAGRTTFIASRVPDTEPTVVWGEVPDWSVLLQDCYKRSTPSTLITRLYANGGTADATTGTTLNSSRAFEVTPQVAGVPVEWSSTAPIAAGETKTIKVNLRRDTTYGSGSMPRVTLSIPGQSPVSTSATDTANTWHEQTISITNSGSVTAELTITLSATGAVGGKAWFAGLPTYPFILAARWYGQVFDEANPFRVTDTTVTLTRAQAAAVSGVAINHTAQTITVTAARTAAEVYCFCMLDLVDNLNASGSYRTRHITSSDGVSFATTYTVVIGTGGSISGRYSDANGAVVAATVSNIVAGSRILIRRTDTNAVLANEIVPGTSFSLNVQTATAIPISVDVRKATAAPFYQPWSTTGSIDPVGGFAVTANQQPD